MFPEAMEQINLGLSPAIGQREFSMSINPIREEGESPSPRRRGLSSSKRSRQSLRGTGYNFNPLRFLATNLIAKNQERKQLERQQKVKTDALNEEKEKLDAIEAEARQLSAMKNSRTEALAEIQSETEDEDANGSKKPLNLDVEISNKKKLSTAEKNSALSKNISVGEMSPRRKGSNLKVVTKPNAL